MANRHTFGLNVEQSQINEFGFQRYSIRSRDMNEVRAELKRRGEDHRGASGPISTWFFHDTLDMIFVSRSRASGIWIQFARRCDFDEMHKYVEQLSIKNEITESEFISEIKAMGSVAMTLANPPYEY